MNARRRIYIQEQGKRSSTFFAENMHKIITFWLDIFHFENTLKHRPMSLWSLIIIPKDISLFNNW